MKAEVIKDLKKLLNVDDDDPLLQEFIDKVDSTDRTIISSKMITRKSKAKRVKLRVGLSQSARIQGMDKIASDTLAGLGRKRVKLTVPKRKLEPLKPVDEMDPRDEAELSVYEQRKRKGSRALRRAGYENGAEAAKRTTDTIPPLRGRR